MRYLIGLLVVVHLVGVSVAWGLPVAFLSDYNSLAVAVTSIDTTKTELWLDADDYSNTTVPATLAVRPVKGYIQEGTVTWNGPVLGDPQFQWLEGGGHSGLRLSNVLWFGADGDGDRGGSSDDREECQNAINAVIAGGTVIVPTASSFYKIDATVLSDALTVATRCNVVIEGELRGTSCTPDSLPPFVMNITADDVVLGGPGTIRGVGQYAIQDNNQRMPGLVRISGDGVVVKDLTFKNPPEVAIQLHGAHRASIYGCKFTGGPLVADAKDPQHYYVYISGGGDSIGIHDNNFFMDSGFGSTMDAIGTSSASDSSATPVHNLAIIDNQFVGIHEHAVYAMVFDSLCSGNIIKYSQDATEQEGSAIKFGGKHNVIEGNTVENAAKGGITVYDASYTVISHNVIYDFGFVGIQIRSKSTTDGINENTINSNVLTGRDSGTVYEGIRYLGDSSTAADCVGGKITNNIITNAGSTVTANAAISVFHANGSHVMSDFDISGNKIRMPKRTSFYAYRLTKSRISGNTILNPQSANSRVINLIGSTHLTIDGNIARDDQGTAKIDNFLYLNGSDNGDIELIDNACFTTGNVAALGANSTYSVFGRGNRLSEEDRLNGVFTMNNVRDCTIDNENVNSADLSDGLTTIRITPLNEAAASVMGSSKSLYVSDKTARTSFKVSTSDETYVPATDHVFAYEIVQ